MAGWTPDPNNWRPFPQQEKFLASSAFEKLYGGAAGGAKTAALLIWALRDVHRRGYHAILFRRTQKQLEIDLLPQAREIYPRVGGTWRGKDHSFHWESGARIEFGGLEHKLDAQANYKGGSFQRIGFDELTDFEEAQYIYLLSRARPSGLCADIVPEIAATSNPGSRGHEWVLERFAPWLYPREEEPEYDPSYKGPWARQGDILWYLRDAEGNERVVPPWSQGAKTRTFIGSKVTDNPIYAGSSYEDNLTALCALDRAQLKDGSWMARPSAGMFFKEIYFAGRCLPVAPAHVLARIRYWDLASTPAERARPEGAWTAGALLSKLHDRRTVIENIKRGQWGPGDVKKMVRFCAEHDPPNTSIVIERDPGQAGTSQAWDFITELQGFDVRAVPPQGDKVTRAKPVSAQAEGGNVWYVKDDEWNGPFFREAIAFPESTKDQIDSLSGGYNQLQRYTGFKGGVRGRRELTSSGSVY